ncbi:hypothetical protein TorRG33x02_194500, partial [Trema orientale]
SSESGAGPPIQLSPSPPRMTATMNPTTGSASPATLHSSSQLTLDLLSPQLVDPFPTFLCILRFLSSLSFSNNSINLTIPQ